MALTTMVTWPSSEQGTRSFSRAAEGADNNSSCDVFTLAWVIGDSKTAAGPMLTENERAMEQSLDTFV